MKLVKLQQGTLEWHAWRLEGLGGSDVAAVLGLSPFVTADELLAEKARGLVRETTFAMRRGCRLEPVAREQFEARRGLRFIPACAEHADRPWMRCSLDGLAFAPAEGGRLRPQVLEVKAPKWQVHDLALAGFVPDDYAAQIQWQLLVTGAEVCWFVSMNDGRRFAPADQLAIAEVRADAEEQAKLLEAAEAFWGRVLEARERKAVCAA